ncbi:hypothetical protein NDU88_012117 [Pleurodeles waltl]|uniref:VWFA domain-containing protein n=1 Tax=Pleurodeles waltl TaxID=8319 RepID=A0AAV7S5M0_PLEWA|nr:hypothetical protein NDU88_012117 [Pleurodeles waltl]
MRQPPSRDVQEIRRVKRQAIALGVMTAISTFVTIVLYRLVEREIFYNPATQPSDDLQQEVYSAASLLKPTQCYHPALLQKDSRRRAGGLSEKVCTCVRHEPGTGDCSAWTDVLPPLRETRCLRGECSARRDIKADIVLLVDGSYSIGISNFSIMKSFLEALVRSFHVSRDTVQFGLVQFSSDPHTEFTLNKHGSMDDVIKAINTMKRRGGNTCTGKAMTHVRQEVFVESWGARPMVPQVLILLTDGKSSDDFEDPSLRLKNLDVEIFAVGVRDYSEDELREIATAPAKIHVYGVEDFRSLQTISFELTQAVCVRIEHRFKTLRDKM